MERKLVQGDYVPDGIGGLETLSGAQEVLARVLYRLSARRGALPFLPRLGSRLHQVLREKSSARQAIAAQYVAEALEEEEQVRVSGVELTMQGEQAMLHVALEWQGESLLVELELPNRGSETI